MSRYFNAKAKDAGASLVTTAAGPQGLDLVFNGNADKSGALFRAIREALPGRDITQKTIGTANIFTIAGQLPALEEEIRYNDANGALAAELEFASESNAINYSDNAAVKRADTQKMAAANQGTEHYRW